VEAELIRGGGGVYDVVVDGKKIFSKDQVGRFPDPGEIVGAIKG
jgi:predicted Rdx family selenoprotein